MKLAVVSDSHHAVDKLENLLKYLRKERITCLAHAGDFITTNVLEIFKKYPDIKTYIARGNMDWQGNVLKAIDQLSHVVIDDVVFLELEGIQIAMSHIPGVAQQSAKNRKIDLFIHGHTHRAQIENSENGLILNPGSLMDGAGFMLVDLPSLQVDRKFRYY